MKKYKVNHVVKVSKALEVANCLAAVTITGLRSCSCLHGKSTSRYGLNRSRSRSGSVVHTVKIISITVRISFDPDRDPDIFVPCKRYWIDIKARLHARSNFFLATCNTTTFEVVSYKRNRFLQNLLFAK